MKVIVSVKIGAHYASIISIIGIMPTEGAVI
jgi:hypothetical protein